MYGFHWVANNVLKDGLQRVAKGEQLGFTQAIDILKLLGAESQSQIVHRVGEEYYNRWYPTKRHGGAWTTGNPKGVVDHYTSVTTAASTLRWFSNEPRPEGSGESSAHYVLDHDGCLMQLVDPLSTVAWHATVANASHVGVETVNCGMLLPAGGNKFLFMNKFVYRVEMSRPPEEIAGKWWEPYTVAQIISDITLKRLLLLAIPMMRPENFKQHSDIAPGSKIDCGPLWPMDEITKLASVGKELNLLTMPWANTTTCLVEETRKKMIKDVADALKPIVSNEQPTRQDQPAMGNKETEVCEANPNLLEVTDASSNP